MSSWLRTFFSRRAAFAPPTAPPGAGLFEARLALYRDSDALPQVVVVSADDCLSLIDSLCKRAMLASQERGGVVPLLALREIVENLLHAAFRDVVVSVLPDGSVLVSDHGPGIPDKQRALRPGFTTASPNLRRYIRGVGSGLSVAQESLRAIGGELRIEDNLGGGTVVSLLVPARHQMPEPLTLPAESSAHSSPGQAQAEREGALETPSAALAPGGTVSRKGEYTKGPRRPKSRGRGEPVGSRSLEKDVSLTARQLTVLRLFAAFPEVGPSTAATEASLSLASAYRELVALERLGYLEPLPGGKRRLSSRGEEILAALDKR